MCDTYTCTLEKKAKHIRKSKPMLHKDYDRKGAVEKTFLIVSLKGFVAKTNGLAVNRQSQSNFDFDLLPSQLSVVAEAEDSSGTQREGNVQRWKPLPSIGL
jgi:hypothetical protein